MMNMRLVEERDLSTPARVRRAAIHRFARDGFGASLRTIADDAGVTAGRIVQLFGSKAGLRHACDEEVFRTIRDSKIEAIGAHGDATALFAQLATMPAFAPLVAYVARSVQAGGDRARGFVDHMVDDAVEYLGTAVADGTIVASRDERARARYLVETSLAHLALRLSIAGPLGHAQLLEFLEAHVATVALPALELYSQGLFTDRRMLDTYLLYVGDPPAGSPPPA